jgi:hypothetical protein
MLAGRPHEAVGNGSPRWMIAASREREHRTRPTGRLTPIYGADLGRNGHHVSWFRSCSVKNHREDRVDGPWVSHCRFRVLITWPGQAAAGTA